MGKSTAWFDRGVAAIQRIASIEMAGKMAGLYVCPLCIRGFDRQGLSQLTREDAPPKSLRGRKLALTCKDCNSSAGADLDSQMAAEDNFQRGWTTRPLRSKLAIGDISANIDLTVKQPNISIGNFRRINSPATSDALAREFDTISGKDLQLMIRLDHDARLAQIGWLRSAYIIAFAALGYSYILQPTLDIVRRQFQDPACNLLSNFCGASGDGSSAHQRMGWTSDLESGLEAIAVQMGRRIALLPGFDPDDDVYAKLAKMPMPASLSGVMTDIPWPTQPMHSLDFEDPRPYNPKLELRSRPPRRVEGQPGST